MITSNIEQIILATKINSDNEIEKNSQNLFLNTLINTKSDEDSLKTNQLTFENINGISIEEIEKLFTLEEEKNLAKNLRLATLFTNDLYLGKALFNTVLGEPFNVANNYLFNIYEDKNIFFKSKDNSLADLLHQSVINRSDEKSKSYEKVSQIKIDQILTTVNSFSFLDALSKGYKNQYDKYKDDNQYSFLYNDYYMKYQELIYKYEDLKDSDKNIINQFK